MKKIFLIFMFIFLFTSSTFAYELSQKDKLSLEKVKKVLWDLSQKKDKVWLEQRIKKIDQILPKVRGNIRFWMIFNELKKEIVYIYELKTPKNEVSNYEFEKVFFETHGKEITTNLKVPEKCTIYYDEIDTIGKEYNFPTALIIAIWWKETNCGLYNPANGWGPFQITSSYHNPGDITFEEFKNDVIEFINFSKNKWNFFNTNTYVNYKQRFGSENLAITYDNYTIRELQIHSILYNGVSSTTTLNGNSFANNNLNKNIIGTSDGVVTRFLKILNWKINR